jgi:ribosomal protein S18 acetylase RimI-like enzyme
MVKNDDLIGMLRLDKHRNYYELSSFAVHPMYQGLGYGGKMLEVTIGTTDLPIWLRVHQDNPAYGMYLRYGFKKEDLVNQRYIMKFNQSSRAVCLDKIHNLA